MSSKPSPQKTDTGFWDKLRHVIYSRKGGAILSQGKVYSHGMDLLEELAGPASYMQVLMLNATGRLPERRFADWVEAVFTMMSYPDSRIWCNKVGAFGGTGRTSPVAAVTAGVLASDTPQYGPGSVLRAMRFIIPALELRQSGMDIEDLIGQLVRHPKKAAPIIPGYARPINRTDERVPVMERLAEEMRLNEGPHRQLAKGVSAYLEEKHDLYINSTGYWAALVADQGLTAIEGYRLVSVIVNAGVMACYVDAHGRPPGSFLPLRCDDIDYQGALHRSVPPRT
jgi:citrate synthase